jgi:hypothetical protein
MQLQKQIKNDIAVVTWNFHTFFIFLIKLYIQL